MEVDYIEDEGWLIFVKGFVDDTHFEGPVSFKTSFHEMEGVKETAQVKGLIGNFRFTAFFSPNQGKSAQRHRRPYPSWSGILSVRDGPAAFP